MTADDRKLERLFDSVVNCLLNRSVTFHWPEPICFGGSCMGGGVAPMGALTQRCNWKDLLVLSAWFLKYGPDVDDDWKRVAREGRFYPDQLHEMFLGVLVGGDGAVTPYRKDRPHLVLANANIGVEKALELFRLQMSNPNPK